MLVLNAADTLAGAAPSGATEVTCTIFGMELLSGVETYKVLDQRQLASSAATIYTVPGSTQAFVRSITVVNTDTTNTSTFQLFRGGTAAANAITPVFTLPAGGMALYTDGGGWQVFDATGKLQDGQALSSAEAFITATVSISAATYADVTGASLSIGAGTWLIVGTVFGAAANTAFLMNCALTDGSNNVVQEGSQFVPASGTASVNAWGAVPLAAIVTITSAGTYKLRASRGTTTITGTWLAQDGSGNNVANNASSNTDKGTGLRAVRIA